MGRTPLEYFNNKEPTWVTLFQDIFDIFAKANLNKGILLTIQYAFDDSNIYIIPICSNHGSKNHKKPQ